MKKYKGILLLVVGFFAGYIFSILLPVVLAHGGNASLIHGCIRNNGLLAGFVRIVGANTNCANNETPLDWTKEAGNNGQPLTCPGCDFLGNGTVSELGNKFQGKNLSDAFLPRTVLIFANLSGTIFVNANLNFAKISEANLTNTIFTGANLKNVDFGISNLTNANLTNADLTNANLNDANANFVNFLNANLTNVDLTRTNLQGATNMDTATLTGVIWNNTICPDATNSDNNGNTCIGHLTP